tara:strand:+ start:1204 stop:2352 length:1149 start_codon:yes stop_codon:yes gene_type:complete
MSKYSLLIQKDIIDSESSLVHAPVVVFLMDRIIISDARVTMEESKSFDSLSKDYVKIFGFGENTFQLELLRIGKIYNNFVSEAEDARMISEAVDYVANEFNYDEKLALIDILEKLAISDNVLNNKELSILYSIVEITFNNTSEVLNAFTKIYEKIVKKHSKDHQMSSSLLYLMNLISEDPKSVKSSIQGRPDPQNEGNIPPVLLTDEEFRDWIILLSLKRASKYKSALMNQSRVYWQIAQNMRAEKGLIKFFNITSSTDPQIDEAIIFTNEWIKNVGGEQANIKMENETVFSVVIFGDEKSFLTPDFSREDVWRITCKKVQSGFEIHAFDISRESKTYWCPESSVELSKKIQIEENWINGKFSRDKDVRANSILNLRKEFDN